MAIRLSVILSLLLSLAGTGVANGSEPQPSTRRAKRESSDLPRPFGVSLAHAHIIDKTRLTNYRPVTLAGFPGETDGNLTFDKSESRTEAYNLRADMWLLPFLNIYVLGGYMEGKSTTIINFRVFPNPGG